MFSGVTGAAGCYGQWKDCHMPMANARDEHLKDSLMTEQQIRGTVSAVIESQAGQYEGLLYTGCKVTCLHTGKWIGSDDEDIADRVQVNRALLGVIEKNFTGVHPNPFRSRKPQAFRAIEEGGIGLPGPSK